MCPTPLLLVAEHVHAHLINILEMELCACVRTLSPPVTVYRIVTYTALDPCIAAANGGCNRNAKCVMTGPGLVSLCVCVCVYVCAYVCVCMRVSMYCCIASHCCSCVVITESLCM